MNGGRFAIALFRWIALTAILAACAPAPSSGVSVWLDVPLDGLRFPDVQAIKIEGHAASSGAVSRVEIWINGALLTTINNPPMEGSLASFRADWTPPAPGEYTIQAVAFGADGSASAPDSARVVFGTEPPPVITDTPTLPPPPLVTDTFTPPPPAGALIQFWAEPSEIQAGACTNIRWHVENVSRVVFGGIDQPFDGSYRDCLCADQRYTLTVTRLDGVEEKRTVDVAVSGSCVTPTSPPPADTTPPPAPTPAVPADGLTIACKASQDLVWLPVSDPSGIAEYRVQVQRHSGDGNWQNAPGSPITGIPGKQTSIPVECGWYYRWRVRAIDGAGNAGPWSGWQQFIISLM